MKKLSPSLVAVKKITSAVPRSNFAEPDLEKLARLILESGGLINPIIVRRNGMDAYEIVDGDFEYYAAARAKEIDAPKGETIGAFILEEENEELLLKQLEILRKTAITENLVENLETGFLYENKINELKAEYAREQQFLAQSIQELENRILQQVPLLVEAGIANRINELKSESLPEKQAVVERRPEVANLASESMSLLEALNTLDKNQLSANLKDAGLKLPIIQIILKERDVRPFVSFANVVERVKGLADKTMIKIIDKWHKYS